MRYDSHEIYFAGSAAEWTDSPGQQLRRYPEPTVLAETPATPQTPLLSLDFLAPNHYSDGEQVQMEDLIGCPTKNYPELARRLHADPDYADRVYGRAALDTREARTWLQYWFFYFYNDFELLGDEFPAGLHEGDWEMVQLRLDGSRDAPDLAVYAKHKSAEALAWGEVERVEDTRPVVYVARGSHAAYFTAGTHWGEAWFDHADGKGPSPELKLEIVHDQPSQPWLHWPGSWGDTKPDPADLLKFLDDSSPRGPAGHSQWAEPHKLLETIPGYEASGTTPASVATPATAAELPEPSAPEITPRRAGGRLEVTYDSPAWPSQLTPVRLIVTAHPTADPLAVSSESIPISSPAGTAASRIELEPGIGYEIHTSIAGRRAPVEDKSFPPLTSPATTAPLPPS